MHTYRHSLPLPAGSFQTWIVEFIRSAAGTVTRFLPRNPILDVAAEMDRLTVSMSDEDRNTLSSEAIARRLRGRAYRVAVSGLIGGFGNVSGGD